MSHTHEERGSVADVAASERAAASLRAAELQAAEPCSELQNELPRCCRAEGFRAGGHGFSRR